MWPSRPGGWATSIVGFALAVLVACLALNWAAALLRGALPVLIPVAVVAGMSTVGWRWWQTRTRTW